MTLTQTPNRFQLRLDELHKLSIALYAEAISNPSDAVVEKIEAIAIEREEVHKAWEESWNNPAAAPATPAATAPAASASATKPHAPKKLMLSLVSVKRISSDVPVCNFDPNELEIAGELSLAHGGFCSPPVLRRDGDNYKVISGHFQYHAAGKGPAVESSRRGNNTDDRSRTRKSSDRLSNAQDVEVRGIDLDRAPSLKLDGVF